MGAKASRIVEEYHRFETQLHNLNDQNTQLQQQSQDLAARLQNSEKALNCYSWQIDTLHHQLEHSEISLHHYGQQIDTLHGQLDIRERELEIKEKENVAAKKELIYFQWRQQLDHRVFGEVLDLPRCSSAQAPPSDIASITSAGDQPVDEYGVWIPVVRASASTPTTSYEGDGEDEDESFIIADEEFEKEAAIDADDEMSSEEEMEEEIVAPVLRRQGTEGSVSTNLLKRPITSISTSTTSSSLPTSTSTNDPKNLFSTRASQYSSGTDGAGTIEEEILRTAKRTKKWEWDWEGNGPKGRRRLVEDMRRARGGDLRDYE